MTIIGSCAALEDGFGSTGRLQEVGINCIDYERCNNLNDGKIVDYSVSVCLVAIKIVSRLRPIFDRESMSLERVD